jgi:hypothetical protein
MKVIHTVRLHRTKGYAMDAVWFSVDETTGERTPDACVDAHRVFDELMKDMPIVAAFRGTDVKLRCRATTIERGIETFDIEASTDAPPRTLRDLRQLPPYGCDSD